MKTKQIKKEEVDPKIAEHFRNLGKKSWEARKAKILDKIVIPKPNVR